MANVINLTITSVALDAIKFTVVNNTIDPLTTAQVKIKKLGVDTFSLVDVASYNVDKNPTTSEYTISPVSPFAFSQDNLLLVQIINTTGTAPDPIVTIASDRVAIDFKEEYDATNLDAEYSFEFPAEPGVYNLNTQTINNETVVVSSADIRLGTIPDTTSTISLVDPKDYLVKFVNKPAKVKVALKDSDGTVQSGNYEVVFKATKQ